MPAVWRRQDCAMMVLAEIGPLSLMTSSAAKPLDDLNSCSSVDTVRYLLSCWIFCYVRIAIVNSPALTSRFLSCA